MVLKKVLMRTKILLFVRSVHREQSHTVMCSLLTLNQLECVFLHGDFIQRCSMEWFLQVTEVCIAVDKFKSDVTG